MVLGTPTMLMPMPCNLVATPRVSSPPMATIAPRLSDLMFFTTCSAPPSFLKGLVRLVPRMVPPRWRMPLVASRVSRSCWGGSSKPRQPSRMPITSRPCCSPRRTTARITALRPGQSPPPVSTAIFISSNLQLSRRVDESTSPPVLVRFILQLADLSTRQPVDSRMKLPARHHHHRAQEQVFLRVHLTRVAAPARPLEPLAREHLPVVGQAADQRRVALRQIALHQGLQERSEAAALHLRVAPVGVQ